MITVKSTTAEVVALSLRGDAVTLQKCNDFHLARGQSKKVSIKNIVGGSSLGEEQISLFITEGGMEGSIVREKDRPPSSLVKEEWKVYCKKEGQAFLFIIEGRVEGSIPYSVLLYY